MEGRTMTMYDAVETIIEEYGFVLTTHVSSDVPREDRSGDHSTYTIRLTANESFMADGPMVWSFSGEIERGVAAAALRELARSLETF
jgi:hypothetical protein